MNAARALSFVLVLACCAPSAMAQQASSSTPTPATVHAAPAAAPALAGEYHLEGVMETGSGLRLNQDGTFDWYFTYGALDLAARGKWTRQGDGVELKVEQMGFPPQFPQTKFDRMHLRVEGPNLVPAWPWDMDAFRKGEERGHYVPE